MNIYWFSFSYKGRNNGVCIVRAANESLALQKTIDLKIHPQHDDIACYELEHLDEDQNMVFNKLYSKEDMESLGYNAVNEIK